MRKRFGIGTCPVAGHPLEPGTVLISWIPCSCTNATGRPKGHKALECRGCWAEGYTTRWYWPYHVGPGHPSAA